MAAVTAAKIQRVYDNPFRCCHPLAARARAMKKETNNGPAAGVSPLSTMPKPPNKQTAASANPNLWRFACFTPRDPSLEHRSASAAKLSIGPAMPNSSPNYGTATVWGAHAPRVSWSRPRRPHLGIVLSSYWMSGSSRRGADCHTLATFYVARRVCSPKLRTRFLANDSGHKKATTNAARQSVAGMGTIQLVGRQIARPQISNQLWPI